MLLMLPRLDSQDYYSIQGISKLRTGDTLKLTCCTTSKMDYVLSQHSKHVAIDFDHCQARLAQLSATSETSVAKLDHTP
jgi:hypothetical protein